MMLDPKAIKKALLVAKRITKAKVGSASNPIPESFLNRSHKEVTKRIPELQEAAKKIRSGEMSGAEYQELVNKHKPVYPYQSVPRLATHEEMRGALKDSQQKHIGQIGQYPEGHPVKLRLDIPAYSDHGVWVPTIHNKENDVIAHQAAAHVKDASFSAPEKSGLNIAAGANKGPYATIKGSLQKTSEEDIHKLAQQYLNHPDWRQVGMDPTRHGYFYDRHTQEPVEHAEEVLQVGPLVLAKNPTYGDKSKYKYASGGDVEQQDAATPARQLNDAGLYSHAAEAAEALPQEKGSPQQMIASLKGVKPDELYWSGVHNAFRDRKTITKQELADHFRDALPQLSSSVLTPSQGSAHDPASKYIRYTAEGQLRSDKQKNLSTNYREVLNTIPNLDDLQWTSGNKGEIEKTFSSSHWNEPNIISHVRLSDRETQPPQVRKPKTPSPDAVTQITGNFGKQDSIAYSTKHKNIFVTPSMRQKNKYAITHGPSGRMISSTPLDFYHAMHNANQLAEKYPHVFDLDEQGITDWIADPKNSEEKKGIVDIVSSEPPALPAPKRAKPFNKEKILHVDESQSDFGQHIKKLNDRLVESRQRLEESTNRHKETQAEFERLSKENPHLFDENGDLISSYALSARYNHGFNASPEQKEKYNQDYQNWKATNNAKDSARNSKFTMEELQRKIPATERDIARIPKAPYVDNTSKWTDLNVKRILTEAAKGNYDKVIWTPGVVQSKIYGIGSSYSKIYYNPKEKVFQATPKRGARRTRAVTEYNIEPEKLPDYIGSELTKKLLATSHATASGDIVHMLQGQGLDVSNPGQEAYYGKIFPRRLIELAREHDPEAQLSEHKDNDKVVDGFPALKITPRMRESILKNGFKAYKSGGYTGDSSILSAAQDPSKAIRKALMVAKRFSKKND